MDGVLKRVLDKSVPFLYIELVKGSSSHQLGGFQNVIPLVEGLFVENLMQDFYGMKIL